MFQKNRVVSHGITCIKKNEVSPLFTMGSHIKYRILEVYLPLVLKKKIIEQLWPLLEVDIQIRQSLTGCFPEGL